MDICSSVKMEGEVLERVSRIDFFVQKARLFGKLLGI